MSLKLSHSKDYHNLLNNVIENELSISPPNNEVLWVQMGNQLEIEGVKKSQISTIVRKDIEDKLWEKEFKGEYAREDYRYCNSKYFQIMKNNGWTNPFMARNVSNDNLDPRMDQEIVPCANPKMKAICYDIINLCRIMIEKSKTEKPFEDVFGKKEMKEFYKQRHTIINNCKNAIDNKTKVPKNTEIFLLECLGAILGSTNKCAEIFMEQNLMRLKEQGKFFTLKQATKFQKGMKQSQLHILKPTSRDQALFLDYVGVQCECGSYRVRQKLDSYKLECYDCDNILPPSHISKCEHCKIPLYKERLVRIVKTRKCENCNEILDLPEELVNYAKS
jgi:hypothetical protein